MSTGLQFLNIGLMSALSVGALWWSCYLCMKPRAKRVPVTVDNIRGR